ncbi:hypothetical protein IGI39_000377 [Enterococcus sp. AZ135]|uniref:hypothetical protein n=1 Tax=unclassified Enterococcus TaxID=2608891 RepID=UPI003F1E6E71
MEIGNIAEWVAGISKIIAIIGAITFPIVRERKRRRASTSRLARREYALVRDIENEFNNSQETILDLESYKQFESFNSMLMIVCDDEGLIQISEEINDLLVQQTNTEHFNQSLRKLLQKLESEYIF